MVRNELEEIPHLFRTEYQKLTAVLCKLFGFGHIEMAEDIASDTFLEAAESWGQKGMPANPTAWLYAVAKNKAVDYCRRNALFIQKVVPAVRQTQQQEKDSGIDLAKDLEIDLSEEHIIDSQLQMMFAICQPVISKEAQICLSLRILCGFGIEEIADAFLTGKETINKRLHRAKEKLRTERVQIEFPGPDEIPQRLDTVLMTIYLLFNEGYYSTSTNTTLRKDLCLEAMRLNYALVENTSTNRPEANALLSLMCFHVSRFESRIDRNGEIVLYEDQDSSLWSAELIAKGRHFLHQATLGKSMSKYHLEAAIAYWHTFKPDTTGKWESILQIYNRLLQIEYSPMAALNRTYALSKVEGKKKAIAEAEKLDLTGQHLYHSLMGELYTGIDRQTALMHFQTALRLAKSAGDKMVLERKMNKL